MANIRVHIALHITLEAEQNFAGCGEMVLKEEGTRVQTKYYIRILLCQCSSLY